MLDAPDFVPRVPPCPDDTLERLASQLAGRKVAVLTGAGCSTESGIPDYRGEVTRQRARSPVQFKEMVRDPSARQRYWARAVVGWEKIRDAQPGPAHRALAAMQEAGQLGAPMTQNVDRLHIRAGSREVIELHGALEEVECLACRALSSREELQERLLERNPSFANRSAEIAPDGDAELDRALIASFEVVGCGSCGGHLKPHVVFFGEGVPRPRVELAFERVEAAEALLVLGSSLAVYSGFRFARRAQERGIPVCIVSVGETRADDFAALKLEHRVGDVLPRLAARLGAQSAEAVGAS